MSTANQSPADEEVLDTEPEVSEVSAPEEGASDDYKEKWQRALAEMENLRKRADQDRASLTKFATESLVEELLPVVDNFERATAHVPDEQKGSAWVTGIQYIQKNLVDVLERRGVSEIPAKAGDAFDPHLHEAIGTSETADQPEDTIVEIKNKGYRLHDRVLRPVLVTVAKAPQA